MNKFLKGSLSFCTILLIRSSLVFSMMEDDGNPPAERKSTITPRSRGIADLKDLEDQVDATQVVAVVDRPLALAIPEIARGYEDIYRRFVNGKLIYRPTEGSDVGKIELPIAAFSNPLMGTFDLSPCGDTGQYLSISTGYRKEKKQENTNKVEIWFSPRFLIEREVNTLASNHHMRTILPSWGGTRASVGILGQLEW